MRFTASKRPRGPVLLCARRWSLRGVLATVSVLTLAGVFGAEALAGSSKYGYGGFGRDSRKDYEYQMREASRQQAEMEQQQREQARAAQEAQREAEKQAARLQAEFEAQQRREQERAMQDAERQRQQAMREMEAQQRQAQQEAEWQRLQAQREMEAQRRQAQQEAERQRQQAQRDLLDAQRRAQQEAERQAQKSQDWAAQQEAQRGFQAQQAAEREAQLAAQRAAERQAQQAAQRNAQPQYQAKQNPVVAPPPAAAASAAPRAAAPRTGQDLDRDDVDDPEIAEMNDDLRRAFQEDESNPNLTPAERRVREIERLRRMEERRQAHALFAFKRRNDERAERGRSPGAPFGMAGKPKDGGKGNGPRDTNKHAGNKYAGHKGWGGRDDGRAWGRDKPGDGKMLYGWQKQAMRLGPGPRRDFDKGKGGYGHDKPQAPGGGSYAVVGSDIAVVSTGSGTVVKTSNKSDASDKKDDDKEASNDEEATAEDAAPPPGAELRPEQFEAAREQELVVPDLSDDDLKTAQAHGFVASAPTEIGKSGTKLVRLRLPSGDRTEAERELHRVLPFAMASPNYAYKIFIGSEGQQQASLKVPGQKTAPASAAPCPEQVCFGRGLIKWTSEHTRCVKDVRVGVIDTSFDTRHPALRKIRSIGQEFLGENEASPYDWHGTAVLSLLAGDPAGGTPGLVPDATFLLAAAFRSDVNGNASTDTVRLLAALAWLEELDVDIVNMSFSGPEDPLLARAIARMSKKGIVFIAAAGNMGPTASPSYPAAYPSVIAVTAVTRDGLNYKNANRGTYIDFSAPGVDILAALPNGQQGFRTGTSFAAPFVTAIVAASGVRMAQGVSTATFVTRLPFQDLGPPGQDPIYGAGLARAPQQCRGGGGRGEVAAVEQAPAQPDPWAPQTTTFVNAGAGFAP
jgi:hypothetical protein